MKKKSINLQLAIVLNLRRANPTQIVFNLVEVFFSFFWLGGGGGHQFKILCSKNTRHIYVYE